MDKDQAINEVGDVLSAIADSASMRWEDDKEIREELEGYADRLERAWLTLRNAQWHARVPGRAEMMAGLKGGE